VAILDYHCDPLLPLSNPAKIQLLVWSVIPTHFHERREKLVTTVTHPLFSGFNMSHQYSKNSEDETKSASQDPSILFRQASSLNDRCEVVVTGIQAKLARALDVSREDPDTKNGTLSGYEIDSIGRRAAQLDQKRLQRRGCGV
jgi:hypothetical protein